MFFKAPPALSSEETKKEQLKLEISEQLVRCEEHLEAIHILISNDLPAEAAHILPLHLTDLGSTLLKLHDTSVAGGLPEIAAALGALTNNNDDAELAVRIKDLIERHLATSQDRRGPEVHKFLTDATKRDLITALERSFRRKRRSSLLTPMDSYKRYKLKKTVALAVLVLIVLASAWLVRNQLWRFTAREQRVKDLLAISDALEAYKRANGSYPTTENRWDGIRSCWGQSRPDWIRGLVPDYIPALPMDPDGFPDKCEDSQYIYRSDGKNYKLICHRCSEVKTIGSKYPHLIDPSRDHALGVWTEGARGY